jgi:predicted DNA-binding transcriptional regulator YafY
VKLAFEGASPSSDEIAAIVAALEAVRSRGGEARPQAPTVSRWRATAREEAVNS